MTDTAPTGPLRDALIDAGIALLNQGGPEGLTLRRAAALAGVSHAAPAHHFVGLAGLQTAVAARAFAMFCDAMEHRQSRAGTDPGARLLAICQGYLDFAHQHGGLFHLMFNKADIDRCDPDLMAQSARAYGILRDACLPFSGGTPDPVFEAAVWSSVHGYAALSLDQPRAQTGGNQPPPFGDVLKRLIDRP